MARVLFATWDGGGNLPPVAATAVVMAKRGHDVRMIGHASQRGAVEAHGLPFESYAHAGEWSSTSGGGVLKVVFDRALGREVAGVACAQGTDLVAVDAMLAGATDAVYRADLTWALLSHTLYLRGPRVLSVLGRLRGMTVDWDAAAAVIVPTLRELDPGTATPPANVHHTGPVWQDHPPVPAEPESGAAPLILVSLSTNAFRGQREILQRVLDAVAVLPVRAFVTTGPAVDPAELRAPQNAELHRFVPHGGVLPRTSLVVGHGGHCTTMRALAHDVPVVVIPAQTTTDQPFVGRALQRHGAGIALRHSASTDRIRAAVERALSDGGMRSAAAGLGSAIRRQDGAVVAADRLEAVLP